MSRKNTIFEIMQWTPEVSVIISTYNQPRWLDLVLYSYRKQSFKDFEIIIADDGSDEETASVIKPYIEASDILVHHIWQKDQGFRKTKILNKAILESKAQYLIFTDGDCIARQDFVSLHWDHRKVKTALSGGYVKLSKEVSQTITKEVISNQSCFDRTWLLNHGQKNSFKLNKLTKSRTKAAILNSITTTKATFDGMNVSCWKEDILAVRGFDERMGYGGEDREVGERMMNNGVKFRQFRYGSSCLHLYHERPYKLNEVATSNQNIRKETKKNRATITNFGIK